MKILAFLIILFCFVHSAFGENYYSISEIDEVPFVFPTNISENNYQLLTNLGIEISAVLSRPNSYDKDGIFKFGSAHVKIRNTRGVRSVSRINLKIRENDAIPLFDPKGTGEVDNIEFVIGLQNNQISVLKFSVYQTKDIKGGDYRISLSDIFELVGDSNLRAMVKEAAAHGKE